jgi:hypothetical protein
VVAAARERGEVAIGYRTAAEPGATSDTRIAVNPRKSETRTWLPDDRIVVIAES